MSSRLTHKSHPEQTTNPVRVSPHQVCGSTDLWIVGGPCAIESMNQLEVVSDAMLKVGVNALRGGAFKPRTSPYSFQGLGEEGLQMMAHMRQTRQMTIVTEVMSIEQIELVAKYADVLQVGSRNMQNFDLLKALGSVDKPILLKRGLAATIEEFLWAAEYVMAHGNPNVILCERGIRSFDNITRNCLDLGGVAVLKQMTHLPVMVDPSHAAGRRDIIADLSRAAIAIGADGLLIETHPSPDESVSDADQALSLETFQALVREIMPVAEAMGRRVTSPLKVMVA